LLEAKKLSAVWKRLLDRSAALSGLFFLVVVNRNRIKILCFENLTAIQAPDIIYAIAPVKELGSLVLTSLHSEVTPILD
jgi:hypothetical protein